MLQVKLFDCEHEADLEEEMNGFLAKIEPDMFVDMKYEIAALQGGDEQIYCFSGMILYRK